MSDNKVISLHSMYLWKSSFFFCRKFKWEPMSRRQFFENSDSIFVGVFVSGLYSEGTPSIIWWHALRYGKRHALHNGIKAKHHLLGTKIRHGKLVANKALVGGGCQNEASVNGIIQNVGINLLEQSHYSMSSICRHCLRTRLRIH